MTQTPNQYEIVLYTTSDGLVKIDTIFQKETIWLNQAKMVKLFDVNVHAISKHLSNIFEEDELQKESTISKMETVQQEGNRLVTQKKDFYQKIRDIYITAIDYDKKSEQAQIFFKKVQNKMLWAVTGKTAAEMIEYRSNTELIDPALKMCGWGALVNAEKSDLFDVLEYLYIKRAA